MAEPFDKQVFLNCPYDKEYEPLFDALVFATLDCGFLPRCAKELNDSGQVRFQKIIDLIQECRFGIHDLSRTELSFVSGLPRFNMPLELGIFLGAKSYGGVKQQSKACLVLDKESFRYQKFLSDLAGHDISAHSDQPDRLIGAVRKWLNQFSESSIPGESKIAERFQIFKQDLPRLCKESSLKVHELTYVDYLRFTISWLELNKLF